MQQLFQAAQVGTFIAFLAGLGGMISVFYGVDVLNDRISVGEAETEEYFDFIVVGSGSAGAVVATRLSEQYNVLLLEAGGEPFPLTYVPTFSFYMLNYPELDWMHATVPQKGACWAGKNQESGWSQGKVLGGTSIINFMIQSRGCPRDYDNWAKLTGDQGWSYESVLPFFKRSENFHGPYRDSGFHGTDGPMSFGRVPEPTTTADVFIEAARELGYHQVDLNGNFTEGFDHVYYNIKNGKRHSTFAAYIKPVRWRQSLKIAKFSHVNKILIDEDNKAYGVEYDRHGVKRRAYASKEVVLSAGAIQSPKLLMLSGVGPKSHLKINSIETKVDSPMVGQNLQDHLSVYLGPFFTNQGKSFQLERDFGLRTIKKYFFTNSGAGTSSAVHGMAFFSTPRAKAEGLGDWADIQLLFGSRSIYKDWALHFSHAFHMDFKTIHKYYEHGVGKDSFFIIVSLARPAQRGEILLRSSNPYEALHIDPKYLQNENDTRTFIEGVKMTVDLVEKTKSFQDIGARFTTEPFPGCEHLEFRSDVYWECFIRFYTISLHHIVGTCAMGPAGSKSVVDSELRVRGVKSLRVVDASVMPVVPIGNTNVPSIMVGEKGSDLILNAWAKSS